MNCSQYPIVSSTSHATNRGNDAPFHVRAQKNRRDCSILSDNGVEAIASIAESHAQSGRHGHAHPEIKIEDDNESHSECSISSQSDGSAADDSAADDRPTNTAPSSWLTHSPWQQQQQQQQLQAQVAIGQTSIAMNTGQLQQHSHQRGPGQNAQNAHDAQGSSNRHLHGHQTAHLQQGHPSYHPQHFQITGLLVPLPHNATGLLAPIITPAGMLIPVAAPQHFVPVGTSPPQFIPGVANDINSALQLSSLAHLDDRTNPPEIFNVDQGLAIRNESCAAPSNELPIGNADLSCDAPNHSPPFSSVHSSSGRTTTSDPPSEDGPSSRDGGESNDEGCTPAINLIDGMEAKEALIVKPPVATIATSASKRGRGNYMPQAASKKAKIANGGVSPKHVSQAEKWMVRFNDLVEFKRVHRHCIVPLGDTDNPPLACWVKRQRRMYKLKMTGRHHSLTDERYRLLDDLGFAWDAHAVSWETQLRELRVFIAKHGHAKIPSRYSENPSLGVWAKCQRRQYRLLRAGSKSNLSKKRVETLSSIGFLWDAREQPDVGDNHEHSDA